MQPSFSIHTEMHSIKRDQWHRHRCPDHPSDRADCPGGTPGWSHEAQEQCHQDPPRRHGEPPGQWHHWQDSRQNWQPWTTGTKIHIVCVCVWHMNVEYLCLNVRKCSSIYNYRIAWNFRMVQFSWMVDLYHFTGLIFADACTHAH